MRRIRTDNALAAVPAGGYVEVFQGRKNASKNAAPQGLPLATLISSIEGGFDTFAELDALVSDQSLVNTAMIDTIAELNALLGDATLYNQALRLGKGAGITDGSGTIARSSVVTEGEFIKTTVFVDLTGLKSSTTDLDIIGVEGPDMVTDGDFAGDGSDWTFGADWSLDTAKADCAPGAGTVMEPAVPLVIEAGATYELTYTMSSYSAGSCVASVGGTNFTSRGSDATFTERVVASDTTNLMFTGDAAGDYQIDDISLKKISGAYIGPFNASEVGTLFRGIVTNLETPATGVTDIDFYAADEATGYFDDAVTDLTETVVRTNGGAWSADINAKIDLTALPGDGQYLYFACGAAGTVGTYTAGQFLFELWGA